MNSGNADEPTAELPAISLRDAFFTWSRVAALSFGGPAGQIAVMHRIIVDEKKWISEARFLHALNYCMLLPGPEAQQLATYIGWLMHGMLGGLMAGGLFILPGVVSILVLSILYAQFEQSALLVALFLGLKPAVMAIVIQAVIRIGSRVLKNRAMLAIAALAFVALFFFDVPFPAVVFGAGVIGLLGGRFSPEVFQVLRGHGAPNPPDTTGQTQFDGPIPSGGRLWMRSIVVSAIFLTLWFGPLAAVYVSLGSQSVYLQEGAFFSKAAVVTFGGAYSVLQYVAQQAVETYGWLKPGEMLDGLGMAETTPGPLIMVVQFVGFMGAYRNPGPFSPLVAGVLGSLVTTWVTFVPCFFWIFLGAPFIERLRTNKLLSAALSAITAAVVGVILNLSVWFALHTLFSHVETRRVGLITLSLPDLGSLNWAATCLAALAFLLTFYWKRPMLQTLAICAAGGVAIRWMT